MADRKKRGRFKAMTANHRDTEEDALGYLLAETWKREGEKLVSVDALLPEAVAAHFAELSQRVRDTIGYATRGDRGGGTKLELDAAGAEKFFADRGTPLTIQARGATR